MPSTEKWSLDNRRLTGLSASSPARKACATSVSSRRSRLCVNAVGCQTAASISSPTNQRNSRLSSICSISIRSERTEKNACNSVARRSISGGIEGRPIWEYSASKRPFSPARTSSAKARIGRSG